MAALADRYQVEIWPLCFDLTDNDAMKGAVKRLMSDKRPLHALVNNAGVIWNALFQMTTMQTLREQFEVNFFLAVQPDSDGVKADDASAFWQHCEYRLDCRRRW
ncbi:SDR family NAD(P)-dependent oxidoreductase [Cronobacter sakazakii]|nr:SDR family NAD(P)-dependent oxidoreductase [Cronobacter sakazakii]